MACCTNIIAIYLLIAVTLTWSSAKSPPVDPRKFLDSLNENRLVWTEMITSPNRQARINSLPVSAINPSGTATTQFHYQVSDAQFVGMAADYANGTVFWSSMLNRTIFSGRLEDGAEASSIFGGTSTAVEGLAVDQMAKNIYWADSAYDWIMMSDYEAKYISIILDTGLEKPRGIATYPQKGYLFWTDWGNEKLIERSTLAGLDRITLVNTSLSYPNGITVDFETERVYWVDAAPGGNRVESIKVDGSNRTLLIEMQPRITHLFDLVINGNDIYMTSLTRQILCIKKDSGTIAYTLSLGARAYGITLFGPAYQPVTYSPCSSNPCQHLCTGAPGNTFQCVCNHGFELTKNGTSCIRDEEKINKPQLLFVSRNEIRRFPANFPDISDSQTDKNKYLISNRTLLVAVEMDARAEMMFYSDYGKREIYRVRLFTGRSIKTIVGGIGSAEGLAVDWLNQNLYWTDAVRRHIAVSRYDGSRRKYLITDDVIRPRSLVIHANQKIMFWTEFGPPAQIERANLDGTGHMVLQTGLSSPNGLAIDFNNDRLFYATRGNGIINSVNFDGSDVERIYQKSGAKYFDIELFRDYLFFTEWGTNSGLHAINLNKQELVKSMVVPKVAYGVRMYDESRQPDGTSVCDDESCDQLCLPKSIGGFACHCSIGFTLADDNVTCDVDIMEDNFVLVADTHIPGIFQIGIDDPMTRYSAIPLEDMVRTIALAYDPVERRVYWTDVRIGSFSRAFLNGTGQQTLGRSGVDGPDGLTIDPISRLLYWTDVTRDSITVSSLDGTVIKTLIDTDLDQPRAIALDPVGGYMYYSDWGAVPKIEKAHMDGLNRQILVDSDIAWPNGIALDLDAGKLYWGDAKIDRIERINLDGSGREMIVNLAPRGHPYGVALHGSYVYWSDWKKYGLMRANKDDGSNVESVGPQTFTRLSEIHIYNSTKELRGTNACSQDNGGCSHLCIPTPTGRVCKCADGIELDSETNTTCLTSNLTCGTDVPHGHFLMEDCTLEPGRRCTVECHPGYWSASEQYDVLCMPSGQWDVDMETFCTVVECPVLNVTENASVVSCADPPIQNSTCTHECKFGYKWSNGNSELTCEKDGTWSGVQLSCSVVTCPALESPDNGMYHPANCTTAASPYDSQCLLFCQDGYRHTGATMRSCGLDGHWSDEEIESVCADTEPPSFGDTCPDSRNMTASRGMAYVFLNITEPVATDNSGGVVTYTRSITSPYRLKGGENIITVIARDESNNTATCEFMVNVTVRYCELLSQPDNGFIADNCTYHYGSVCHFHCIEGYRLRGSNTRTCDIDKSSGSEPQWQGEASYCDIIDCPQPVVPSKVEKSGCDAPYLPGKECTYMCAPGYFKVNGSSLRTCLDNGTWSGQNFYCESRRCDPIPAFEHSVIEPASCMTIGGTVHNVCILSCALGYRYQGKSEHVCQEIGGWSNYDDSHICEDATAPHFNGTCPPDRTIFAPPGTMEAVVTWDPPQPVDTYSEIQSWTSSYESGVTLPEGTHAIVINATDTAGNTGTCRFYATVKVIRCPEQLLPSNSHMVGECSPLLGSNCTLACREGYVLAGSSVKTCIWDGRSSSGNWVWANDSDPVCQAITCPPFNYDSSDMMVLGCSRSQLSYPYGSRCRVFCLYGGRRPFYSIMGPQPSYFTSNCQIDGTWSQAIACRTITCPALSLPPKVIVRRGGSACTSSDPVNMGTVCSLGCEEGYQLSHVNVMTRCTSDGTWTRLGRLDLECQDVTPPQFDPPCPRQLSFTTETCTIKANVTYAMPNATDNVSNITVTGPNETMPILLSRGRHQRIYTARDEAGNVETCLFNINVQAPTCREEPEWRSGALRVESMSCRNLHGSVARFTCTNPAMRLIGMRERTCQENGEWSGTTPSCEIATCPGLTLPPHTVASPSTCATSPLVDGATQCKVTCARGFRGSSMNIMRTQCTLNGTWTKDISGMNCIDIAPPVFSYCPAGMSVTLEPGANTAQVQWRTPISTDNIAVVSTTTPEVTPPVQLAPGTELFTYTATDAQGLTGTCSFDVTVVDAEPPRALNCPFENEVAVVQADELPVRVDYTEPMFTDNVGIAHTRSVQWYTRYQWENNVAYEWGYTELNYQATDSASNAGECNLKFEIVQSTVCPELVAPPNSQLTCDESGMVCSLECNEGYFQTSDTIQTVFGCQPSGLWNSSSPWDKNPFLPVCTRTQIATPMTWMMTGDFAFDLNGACEPMRENLETEFKALFRTSSLFKDCTQDTSASCTMADVTLTCRSSPAPDEGPRRRKRQSDSSSPSSSAAMATLTMTTSSDTSVVPSFFNSYSTSVNNMWSETNVSISLPNMTATLDPDRSELSGFMPVCANNQYMSDMLCEYCPPGTFKNLWSSSCERCRKGSYQDQMGQTRCVRCVAGKSTRATGAYSVDQCLDMCLPGTYSYTGLGPNCLACPVGSFQGNQGQRGCEPCYGNTTTSGPGSSSAAACMINPPALTSPRPTTDDDIDSGGASTPDTNQPTEPTQPAILSTEPSPSIAVTSEGKGSVPTTKTSGESSVPPRRKPRKQAHNHGMIIGICIVLFIIVVVIVVIVVMIWRRRSYNYPMIKLTNIGTGGDYSGDEDDDIIGDGKYHQMQEVDNFDLEHLATFGDEDTALQAKRNSFSNALYKSEDDPSQDPSKGNGQVWTTFDESPNL